MADVPAVRDGRIHEITSTIILQPGPAALTDGVAAVAEAVRHWALGTETPRPRGASRGQSGAQANPSATAGRT
ncbi:MAG: hypothetical protein R2752_00165 [Vicinamibacterales bacterium]